MVRLRPTHATAPTWLARFTRAWTDGGVGAFRLVPWLREGALRRFDARRRVGRGAVAGRRATDRRGGRAGCRPRARRPVPARGGGRRRRQARRRLTRERDRPRGRGGTR